MYYVAYFEDIDIGAVHPLLRYHIATNYATNTTTNMTSCLTNLSNWRNLEEYHCTT